MWEQVWLVVPEIVGILFTNMSVLCNCGLHASGSYTACGPIMYSVCKVFTVFRFRLQALQISLGGFGIQGSGWN